MGALTIRFPESLHAGRARLPIALIASAGRALGEEPFPLPVAVRISGERHHLSMAGGAATLPVEAGAEIIVDLQHRVLTAADLVD